MIPLVIIRPEPGNSASRIAAEALGLKVLAKPLFAVVPVKTATPSGPFDAVLAGSANVFRHGGPAIAPWRHLPVYAVGESTAIAARGAGFDVAATGQAGLQAVLDALPHGTVRVLRLAGQSRVALNVPSGLNLVEQVVYAVQPLPLPPDLAADLRSPAVIALHSAEAARHLARLITDRRHLALACIGARVAAAAGPGWGTVRSAAQPDDPAILALAAEMCQTPGSS